MSRLNLPRDVESVLREFFTCEFSTINRAGQPLTWPTLAYFDVEAGELVTTASIAFPVKALNARRNPRVSLLFSDPTGSQLVDPPAVLIQGDASVREGREMTPQARELFKVTVRRQPDSLQFLSNRLVRGWFTFYFQRLMITVRPRRITWWPRRDFSQKPLELELDGLG